MKATLADGTISLQAMANNHQYVSTDLNNGAVLSANKAAVGGAWEAFNLVTGGSSTVSKPAEAPSYIWNYAVNADNRFGKNGDFALLICAVIKQETSYGADSSGPSGGDGLMQVEPNTRNGYSGKFSSTFGHAYNHSDQQDQVYMGAMILNDMINLAGANNIWRGLVNYNGGPNWYPGATDSYGRPILVDQYDQRRGSCRYPELWSGRRTLHLASVLGFC
ncbi:transglycosylase SLT domain-containing protein [Paenibacillus monticola]|nr:transglycosylase SLT domain-containing protein [Paenibacillus monticola]